MEHVNSPCLPTYFPTNTHISLLYTVSSREMWVSVKFTRNFPRHLNTTEENIQVSQLKNQHLGEDSDSKSPSFFLEHLSQECQVGHTIDRCITLTGSHDINSHEVNSHQVNQTSSLTTFIGSWPRGKLISWELILWDLILRAWIMWYMCP